MNIQNSLVSIIVPIYNVEKFLPKCIESLLAQTHKELEIILVNDGSTDSSPQICEKYAQKDNRIKVIHQQNAGDIAARKSGFDNSNGEYISFVDGDDFLDDNAIEILVYKLKNFKAQEVDIVSAMCRIVKENSLSKAEQHKPPKTLLENPLQEGLDLFIEGSVLITLWGKLYKRNLLENVKFYDPTAFYQIWQKAKRVALIDDVIYNYTIRKNSWQQQKMSLRKIKHLENMFESLELWSKTNKRAVFLVAFYTICQLMRGYIKESEPMLKKYVNILRENKKFISVKSKINIIFFTLIAYGFPYKPLLIFRQFLVNINNKIKGK